MVGNVLPMSVISLLGSEACVTIVLTILVVIFAIVHQVIKNKGLPPGPIGVPYFGILPFLKNDTAHLQLQEMTRQYGDLFSFRITGRLFVNLSTAKVVREAQISKSDCFQSRPQGFTLVNYIFENGVSLLEGEPWKVVRKFFLSHLKEKGIFSVKDHLGEIMRDAMKETVNEMRQANGEPLNIMSVLMSKCSFILQQSLFGDSDVTEEQVKALSDSYAIVVSCLLPVNLLFIGPVAKFFIFPFLRGYREIRKNNVVINNLLSDIIESHKATFKEEHIRDVIDSFIKERNDRQKKGDPTAGYFTDYILRGSLYQFVGDGVLSVAYFVMAFLKASIEHPEEQKIYQELVEVVGPDRSPTLEDKINMPYTSAFILEVMRTTDFISFFPNMECTKETTLQGYRIPKGTITVLNFWTAHYDPKMYDSSQEFNPSRFLPITGRQRAELPINFGIGKRACIGKSFTMSQVFLFLTTIIQNFELSLPDEKQRSTFEEILRGEMKIRAIPRSQ